MNPHGETDPANGIWTESRRGRRLRLRGEWALNGENMRKNRTVESNRGRGCKQFNQSCFIQKIKGWGTSTFFFALLLFFSEQAYIIFIINSEYINTYLKQKEKVEEAVSKITGKSQSDPEF